MLRQPYLHGQYLHNLTVLSANSSLRQYCLCGARGLPHSPSHTLHSQLLLVLPSLPLGSQLPRRVWANRSAGESSHPSCSPRVSSPVAKSSGGSFYCIFFLSHCGLWCCRCMGGQCIAQSWQAGVEIPGSGIGSGSLTVMLKEGEEGEANQREIWFLFTGERKERGEGQEHFVGRHVQPPQTSQRQWPQGRTGHGEGLPLPRDAFPTALDLGTAKTQKPCCEHNCFLKALLLFRRDKNTGAKFALWRNAHQQLGTLPEVFSNVNPSVFLPRDFPACILCWKFSTWRKSLEKLSKYLREIFKA